MKHGAQESGKTQTAKSNTTENTKEKQEAKGKKDEMRYKEKQKARRGNARNVKSEGQ